MDEKTREPYAHLADDTRPVQGTGPRTRNLTGSHRMTERRPDWLTIVLTRGLSGLPGFSLIRFLLSLLLWSVIGVVVVFGMLALILDSAGG